MAAHKDHISGILNLISENNKPISDNLLIVTPTRETYRTKGIVLQGNPGEDAIKYITDLIEIDSEYIPKYIKKRNLFTEIDHIKSNEQHAIRKDNYDYILSQVFLHQNDGGLYLYSTKSKKNYTVSFDTELKTGTQIIFSFLNHLEEIILKEQNKLPDKSSPSYGTGFFVGSGIVVTNAHVLKNHKIFWLQFLDGRDVQAKIILKDKINDLALLKPIKSIKLPLSISISTSQVQAGGKVFTIGYPLPNILSSDSKVTDGLVSSLTGLDDDPRVYQISVALQPGNSGGPLLNLKGEIVGVTTSKLDAIKIYQWTGDVPQNVNFAIKSTYLIPLLTAENEPNKEFTEPKSKKEDIISLVARLKNSVVRIKAE